MKKFIKKSKFLLLGLLVVAAFVGSTFAYLRATDTQIVNTFKFAKVETSIDEKTEDTSPDNTATKLVKIQNNEVSPVFVRARVVVSGADAGFVTGEAYKNGEISVQLARVMGFDEKQFPRIKN